jgi:hypothetical protein
VGGGGSWGAEGRRENGTRESGRRGRRGRGGGMPAQHVHNPK